MHVPWSGLAAGKKRELCSKDANGTIASDSRFEASQRSGAKWPTETNALILKVVGIFCILLSLLRISSF